MNLEIHDLRILRAIAETGSIAGAARQLGTGQSNVSRHLQRIERAAGTPLFRRHHGGTAPTTAGRILLCGAQTLLSQFDSLLSAVAAHTRGEAAADGVRIGSIRHPVLPAVAGAIHSLLPDAALRVRTDDSSAVLLEALRAQDLDVAVLRRLPLLDPPLPDDVESAVIAPECLCAGVGTGHRLAAGTSAGTPAGASVGMPAGVSPEVSAGMSAEMSAGVPLGMSVGMSDLASETCVMTGSRTSPLRRHFLAAATAYGGTVPELAWAPDESVATALACASAAVHITYPPPAPTPGVVYRPLRDEAARSQIVLAWTCSSSVARHASSLAEAARNA
ncbi:LysR family transcriptional regulator [Streptomyces sp. p1417]|uniref:LysR family transcriptional regulator n=1 Tax=Streptomyces typhae TaxID=2681492 RepID=A0A6L6WP82_9ACTN|nr:LysR family transcriptional regulator [Streptomyces typhae]MVO84032.1 LysR family transcriptional regulator [Streptomyces typhae]